MIRPEGKNERDKKAERPKYLDASSMQAIGCEANFLSLLPFSRTEAAALLLICRLRETCGGEADLQQSS